MHGHEWITDQAIAWLQARLPAKLAELNAEAGVVALAVPEAASYFAGGRFPIPNDRMPAVAVSPPTSTIERMDLAGLQADGTYSVMVALWATDPDSDVLTRRIWRYGRALGEVMMRYDSCGPGTAPRRAQFRYARSVDPASPDSESWVSGALLILEVEVIEPL